MLNESTVTMAQMRRRLVEIDEEMNEERMVLRDKLRKLSKDKRDIRSTLRVMTEMT